MCKQYGRAHVSLTCTLGCGCCPKEDRVVRGRTAGGTAAATTAVDSREEMTVPKVRRGKKRRRAKGEPNQRTIC